MKKNIILMIIGLMITGSVYAQNPKEKNPEFHQEMKDYVEQNVLPVLQKKQAEFDSKLNADDQAFIQAKRIEAKEKREKHHAKRKARHEEFKKQNPELVEKRKAEKEAWKNMTEEERKAKKEEWKNMNEVERKAKREEKKAAFKKFKKPHDSKSKTEHQANRKEVKEFMERNKTLVEATMTDLKPLYQKWTADQLNIIKKYHPEKAEHLAKKEGHLPTGLFGLTPNRKHHKMRRHGKHRMHDGKRADKLEGKEKAERTKRGKGKKRFGARKHAMEFVLWDGSMPSAEPRNKATSELQKDIRTSEISMGQNFPNPAKSMTRIELDLPTEMSKLDLLITDMQGKVVKRIQLTDLNAGNETIELNVSDLPNGQYFYSIEGKGIQTTKKMTVNH